MEPDAQQPQPDPVTAARLAMMGLSADELRAAIREGHDDAAQCTGNDVASRAGYMRWSTPLRYLGDTLGPRGFERQRPRNFELLVSPDKTFGFTIAPGDAATGTSRMPTTRIDRGPLTRQAITGNRFQLGFDVLSTDFAREMSKSMQIWLLLHYFDEFADEIKVELSLPVEFTPTPKTDRGFVTAFDPRLLLPPITTVDTSIDEDEDEDEGDEGIDVPVTRR